MSRPSTALNLSSYKKSPSRPQMWAQFVAEHEVRSMAEVGVYRGQFAEKMLDSCPDIESYYLIDPWQTLEDWNKPVNRRPFEEVYQEALTRTEKHADRRVVLRGRTSEVVDELGDGEIDFIYVDGDHTLRGISIDLIQLWPKVRDGGFLGGDDFTRSIWQHREDYEPSFVFPWAVYFAEAMRATIWAMPHSQFLIHKANTGFQYVDLTGKKADTTVLTAIRRRRDRAQRALGAAADEAEKRSAVQRIVNKLRDRS